MKNFNRPLILASNSPRRQELLKAAGFNFKVRTSEVDETYPSDLPLHDIAKYLARKKAEAYIPHLKNEVLITADTIVKLKDEILEKPKDADEATKMLRALSGTDHEVITGVCIADKKLQVSLDDTTKVYFKTLTSNEIEYYVSQYEPFDKAGAYGIQEWIGMIGIRKIVGSYFNVVGLPIAKVYEVLMNFNQPKS
ncbi:Septum formation protein Maf [Fulvivirga imtechensis AK7]|uniref:dTTP/UTP pyrophosphatase n=1 Tax=Fulvivirga imtechensis AK7 TaxID=1237149 RepID=L8K0N5_9BACT|nr:Maf family protein [Fulvivirga imtechensis]ELR73489.1 Septum formation protein Maf [Fulvivirga imtechensis AK7]